jgi:hypothetical protein
VKALKCNAEKKESNRKRRKVENQLRFVQRKKIHLQEQLAEVQHVVAEMPLKCVDVRHPGENRGMTAGFEAHVRSMMATGGSARQVRDNLVLNATHFLETAASAKYTRDIPTERWFSLQREALGVGFTHLHL